MKSLTDPFKHLFSVYCHIRIFKVLSYHLASIQEIFRQLNPFKKIVEQLRLNQHGFWFTVRKHQEGTLSEF